MKLNKMKVYEYEKCSTCKKALKFLDQKNIPYEALPIVDQPPTEAELRKMLQFLKGDFKKLFNTSGQVYRELKLGEKVKSMTADQAIELLKKNGKLIKRPFVISENNGWVGFKEEDWIKNVKS